MDDRGLIYLGAKREVLALDPRDGRTVWTHRLDEWFGPFQTMLIEGESLLVARNARLYCLDARSGDRRWKADLPSKLKHAPIMMISAAGGSNAQQQLAAKAAQAAQQQAAMAGGAGAAAAAGA